MKYIRGRRRSGQSLPLLALMMVFVIAMVGFSVDLSNTYAQERNMQNAANAGALAGINTVVSGKSNQEVWTDVQRTMAGNRVNNGGVEFGYRVDYILQNGTRVRLGDWNGYTSSVVGGNPPANIVRVQVTMTRGVETYFTRVVGKTEFNVHVNGNACLGGYGLGVLALGVPQTLAPSNAGVPYHQIYNANGSLMSTSDPAWGIWNNLVGRSIRLPMPVSTEGVPGTWVPWLQWQSSGGSAALRAAMTYPGTVPEGYTEATSPDSTLPNSIPLNKMTLGDWVSGTTAAQPSLVTQLQTLKSDDREIALPIYDRYSGTGPSMFHIVRMGRFKIKDFSLATGSSFIRVEYLGDKPTNPTECVGEPSDTPPETKTYTIDGTTNVNRVWGIGNSVPTTYDILIILDASRSMRFDWNDRDPDRPDPGWTYPRMRDAKRAVLDFVRDYDIESDEEARMAFITFGGTSAHHGVGWQDAGCPEPTELEPDPPCTADDKWKPIQSMVNGIDERYGPDGNTPGPSAFEMAQTMLQDRRNPSGKRYGQIVLLATDGVFNVCGSYTEVGIENCGGAGTTPGRNYEIYDPGYNIMPGRPIWQAQRLAAQLREAGTRIFVVALTPTCLPNSERCFDPQGLPEMSNGEGYYYEANNPAQLATIYSTVREHIETTGCIPQEKQRPAITAQIEVTMPSNPTFIERATVGAGGKWRVTGLKAGQYVIKVNPAFTASEQDGVTRTYSRIVNERNPNEEDQATVDITETSPNNASFDANMTLTMPRDPVTGALIGPCPEPATP